MQSRGSLSAQQIDLLCQYVRARRADEYERFREFSILGLREAMYRDGSHFFPLQELLPNAAVGDLVVEQLPAGMPIEQFVALNWQQRAVLGQRPELLANYPNLNAAYEDLVRQLHVRLQNFMDEQIKAPNAAARIRSRILVQIADLERQLINEAPNNNGGIFSARNVAIGAGAVAVGVGL